MQLCNVKLFIAILLVSSLSPNILFNSNLGSARIVETYQYQYRVEYLADFCKDLVTFSLDRNHQKYASRFHHVNYLKKKKKTDYEI